MPSSAPRERGDSRSILTISTVLLTQLAAAASGSPISNPATRTLVVQGYQPANTIIQNTGAVTNTGLAAIGVSISARKPALGRMGCENSHSHMGWRRFW